MCPLHAQHAHLSRSPAIRRAQPHPDVERGVSLWSVDDLGRDGLDRLIRRAHLLKHGSAPERHPGLVALAFFQSSTRTRLGFARAAIDTGAIPVDIGTLRFTEGMSAAESLGDTVRMVDQVADVVILRHSDETAEGTARALFGRPVVNGGLGSHEHPSQAVVDLFAIHSLLGRIDHLRWGIVGDLRGSRAAHSLLRALRWLSPAEVRLMVPLTRRPDARWTEGLHCEYPGQLDLSGLDVLYMAGLPAGTDPDRLSDEERGRWRLDRRRMDTLPPAARVLCPLPRIDEIDPDCDDEPRAAWFDQSAHGRWARVAVMEEARAAVA